MTHPPDANPVRTAAPAGRLDSWKAIAAYFDRDVRTVQLWEKKEALPVHRHEHSARASVYAYPPELDRWRRSRQGAGATPAPASAAADVRRPSRRRSRVPLLAVGGGVAAMACVAAVTVRLPRPRPAIAVPAAPAPPPMLAVLPFDDLSGPHANELWVDGLTDDLITDLGRTPGLQVISRRSVMPFRGTQEPLPSVAAKLHATLVLEGSLVHRDGQTRVNAQLVDAAHDRQVWAAGYSRDGRDVLALQDEVAGEIAAAVGRQLTGKAVSAGSNARTVDPQVRLDYLTGLYLFNRRDEADMLKAVDAFHAAIARDPRYAPAYAGLADCYNLLATWGRLTSAEAFPRARAAALTALRLDPDSAEARTSLALEEFRYEWRFADAERDFREALRLDPNYAPAHHWYGQALVDQRRFDEGLHELEIAQGLDPLSAIVSSDVADAELYAGRTADGIAALRRVLELYPDFVPAHDYLAAAYGYAHDLPDALREAETCRRLSGNDAELARLHLEERMRSGRVAEARAEAARLARDRTLGPVQRADLYVTVGEPDQAYAALEQARAERNWWLVTLPVDPTFAALRSEPRFRRLEAAIGLPTAQIQRPAG